MLLIGISGLQAQTDPFEGWLRTETEHFLFIYEPRDQASIDELTGFCEDVYDKLTDFFGYCPDTVPCVLHGRLDYSNGSYAAYPNRLNLYVTAPKEPLLGTKTENWLEALLIHEFTHYLHLTYNQGFFHALGRVFGEDIATTPTAFQPGWMIEGIAVLLETKFTSGGRGRNPFTELSWKAPAIEDSELDFRRVSYSSPYPPRSRHWHYGYLIVSYMTERFGDDVFLRIHREFVRFPLLGPRSAVKKVTGLQAGEIYANLMKSLELKYAENRGLPETLILSPDVTGDYYLPRITESGWYLYRRTLEKYDAIVRFDPESGKEQILYRGTITDPGSLDFTAAGDLGVFASSSFNSTHPTGQTHSSDLYLLNTGSGNITRLTRDAHVWQPAISADGRMITAVQKTDSYSRLIGIDPESGKETLLFSPGKVTIHNPTFSPGGSSIAFALKRRGYQDIWIYDISTGTAEPIFTPDIHGDYYPRYIDENTLLFSSDRDGDLRLYTWHLESRTLREVRRDRIAAYAGTLDGDRLIYASYSTKGWNIKSAPHEPGEAVVKSGAPVEGGISAVLDKPAELPAASAVPGSRYIDLPRPLAWAPIPAYLDPLGGHLPTDFGIGVFGYGASYLGRSEWYGYLVNGFEVFQPAVYLEIFFHISRVKVEYNFNQSYFQSGTDFAQALDHSIGLQIPLFAEYRLGRSISLSLLSGLQHLHTMWRGQPFHLYNWFDFNGFNTAQRLYYFGGLGFVYSIPGSTRQIFRPLRFSTTTQANVPLPILPDSATGFIIANSTQFQFRSFFPNQFVKLGAKMNYTTPSILGGRNSRPRGLFDGEAQPHPGSTLFSFDYLFALGVFDQPLPIGYNMFGLHIRGITMGLHAEIITDWDYLIFELDENIYTGIEFIFDVGASLASVPVGIGLSFRFDRNLTRPVSLADDLRPYIFIGLDSFGSRLLGLDNDARDLADEAHW